MREQESWGEDIEGDVVAAFEDGVEQEVHGGGVAGEPPREERVPPAVEQVEVRRHGRAPAAAVVELPHVEGGVRLRQKAGDALAHPPRRVKALQVAMVEHHRRPRRGRRRGRWCRRRGRLWAAGAPAEERLTFMEGVLGLRWTRSLPAWVDAEAEGVSICRDAEMGYRGLDESARLACPDVDL